MKKKILIFPIQTGYAHLMRCIAVAEKLANSNSVAIAIHEKKAHLFKFRKDIKVIQTNEETYEYPNRVLLQYFNDKAAKKLINTCLKIVDQEKPDMIITDVHPAGMVAAWLTNTKQIMMVNSHIFPYSKGFPGFFSHSKTILQEFLGRPIEFFLDFWKNFFIGRVIKLTNLYGLKSKTPDQAIRELPIIVPEFKKYNPLRKYLPNIHFVGPILYDKIEKRDLKLEKRLEKLTKKKQVVYLTFGGTGFGKSLLKKLINMLTKKYFVILATGNIIKESEVKENKNLFVRKFIPGFSAAKIADIVVSHGSYGTVVQALHWGKPIVCIPFNLDQVYHGLKVQEFGVGKTLSSVSPHHFLMNFDQQQRLAENFDPLKISKAIDMVINDKNYQKNAKKISTLFQDLDGAQKATNIIQSFMS